jgi:hypothetical protein
VRNAIAVSRRNVRIKHEAGLLFYKWAVAIGEKLEQIESDSTSAPENKETKDVTDNTRQVEEDFLDEGWYHCILQINVVVMAANFAQHFYTV